MFDGVILGDACLIVMSSTRRLQAITGNAGFPSSPHGCLDCDRPPRCRDRKACCPTFFGVDIQSTSLRKFISSAELFRFGDDGFFAVDITTSLSFSRHTAVLLWLLRHRLRR